MSGRAPKRDLQNHSLSTATGSPAGGASSLARKYRPSFAGASKKQAIDDGKHRRVGADPQGERDDNGEREARLAAQAAHRIADILHDAVYSGKTPCVARIIAARCDGADPPASRGLRGVSRESL